MSDIRINQNCILTRTHIREIAKGTKKEDIHRTNFQYFTDKLGITNYRSNIDKASNTPLESPNLNNTQIIIRCNKLLSKQVSNDNNFNSVKNQLSKLIEDIEKAPNELNMPGIQEILNNITNKLKQYKPDDLNLELPSLSIEKIKKINIELCKKEIDHVRIYFKAKTQLLLNNKNVSTISEIGDKAQKNEQKSENLTNDNTNEMNKIKDKYGNEVFEAAYNNSRIVENSSLLNRKAIKFATLLQINYL